MDLRENKQFSQPWRISLHCTQGGQRKATRPPPHKKRYRQPSKTWKRKRCSSPKESIPNDSPAQSGQPENIYTSIIMQTALVIIMDIYICIYVYKHAKTISFFLRQWIWKRAEKGRRKVWREEMEEKHCNCNTISRTNEKTWCWSTVWTSRAMDGRELQR